MLMALTALALAILVPAMLGRFGQIGGLHLFNPPSDLPRSSALFDGDAARFPKLSEEPTQAEIDELTGALGNDYAPGPPGRRPGLRRARLTRGDARAGRSSRR